MKIIIKHKDTEFYYEDDGNANLKYGTEAEKIFTLIQTATEEIKKLNN